MDWKQVKKWQNPFLLIHKNYAKNVFASLSLCGHVSVCFNLMYECQLPHPEVYEEPKS